jgi:hypothetical protein
MKSRLFGPVGVGVFALGLITSAHAALLGRLPITPDGTDYRAYYDDVLDITRLADAKLAARSLSDLGDRSEQGGRASTEFHDFEAHSGSMQRDSGELWAALPPAQ